MSRILALLGCALLASCGGDPSVEALRSFLRAEAASPSDPERLDELNRTFASEAIRAGAVARQLERDSSLYSPVVTGGASEPVDVRIWRDRGLIDAEGRFAPSSPGRALGEPPSIEGLASQDASERAARLSAALLLLAPELKRLEWSEGGEHALRISADKRTASANPRLLLLLQPVPTVDSLPSQEAPGVQPPPLDPSQPAQPSGPEAGFHSEIETGNECVDILFLVLLAPAWIAWHAGDLCGFGLCSTGGLTSAGPSPFLPFALLPMLLAIGLARRRR